MKKIIKGIFIAVLVFCLLTVGIYAQNEKKVSGLCIGNSILQHPPAAHLGWYWNWGMAASAEDKDYYSVMQKLIKEDFPDYEVVFDWCKFNINNKVLSGRYDFSFDCNKTTLLYL